MAARARLYGGANSIGIIVRVIDDVIFFSWILGSSKGGVVVVGGDCYYWDCKIPMMIFFFFLSFGTQLTVVRIREGGGEEDDAYIYIHISLSIWIVFYTKLNIKDG